MKSDEKLTAAKTAAMRVLSNLPKAAESLDQLMTVVEAADLTTAMVKVQGVEPMMITHRSVEQLAEGFREVVETLEAGKMGKELAATMESENPLVLADNIERAAQSINEFISSLEAAGPLETQGEQLFKLGKLSGAAELLVESMEAGGSIPE